MQSNRKVWLIHWKIKQEVEIAFESDPMSDITEKIFKVVIINMFITIKNINKGIKDRVIIFNQIGNINKQITIILKNQIYYGVEQ